jgi:predicted metal-dependent enzyme (double-stranded beta helix superfamily)
MFDLQAFVTSCRRCVQEPDAARAVLDLMRSAVGDAEGIGHAVRSGGSQSDILDVPLFRSPELTILNVALAPHFVSAPHDHRMWAVVGIYAGQEDNVFYRRSGARLDETGRRSIRAGDALLLDRDVVHAIANPLGAPTLGLHVYGGDLLAAARSMWEPRSHAEHPFESKRFFAWCAALSDARDAPARG